MVNFYRSEDKIILKFAVIPVLVRGVIDVVDALNNGSVIPKEIILVLVKTKSLEFNESQLVSNTRLLHSTRLASCTKNIRF